jgi:hypothetical protein
MANLFREKEAPQNKESWGSSQTAVQRPMTFPLYTYI